MKTVSVELASFTKISVKQALLNTAISVEQVQFYGFSIEQQFYENDSSTEIVLRF